MVSQLKHYSTSLLVSSGFLISGWSPVETNGHNIYIFFGRLHNHRRPTASRSVNAFIVRLNFFFFTVSKTEFNLSLSLSTRSTTCHHETVIFTEFSVLIQSILKTGTSSFSKNVVHYT